MILHFAHVYISLLFPLPDFCIVSALSAEEDHIDARLTLSSLLLEEDREDEAIILLSPPKSLGIKFLTACSFMYCNFFIDCCILCWKLYWWWFCDHSHFPLLFQNQSPIMVLRNTNPGGLMGKSEYN